ncbi:drug exporter of the RND superfamily-like protein [Nakamurella multipartita DSM 44233]|uniref:Drug exporter of the RND superfamily-like protein n=2 Tax=Nakamurella TaxID=53460 RepID=C8XGT4_NAKMY|nr:drug exporter of the RND superfamily-like protein [Nakamurella multipartita DSM 44233]
MQRIGVWCWRRRVLVVGLWLLAMAGGAVAIGPLFAGMGDTTTLPGTETGRAQAVIDGAIDHGEQFFAVVDNVDAGSAATTAALAGAADDIRAITGVSSVDGPIAATDGRAATLIVTLAPAESQYQPFTDAQARWSELTAALPGATVSVGGGDLIGDEANAAVQDDLRNAEIYSLPLTLILLLLIFGGVAAAALPAVAAIATMLGATAVLLGFASVVTIDANAITVVTLLGLGLSIDYGLLLVARFRDELTRTGDRIEAVAAAWHTAGRTIGFSALTVVAALAGLMAFDVGELRALAAAGIATVIVAMLAGITLTAALLGFVGRWIKPRQRHGRTKADSGFFAGLARRTQRRPWLTLAGCAVVLLALAAPLLHVIIKVPQLEGLPRTLESVQVADVLDQRFGISSQAGVAVLARTDPATLDAYAQPWAADPAVARVEPASAIGAGVSMVVLDVHGDGQGAGAQALVDRLRQDRPAGYESWVTGDAARLMDLQDRLIDGLPLAAAIVVLSMLIVLFLMTGSVVVGVKAIVVSALSLAATFGVLTAVFQDGWLAAPLGMLTVGGLSPFMIVIVFAFAFGLSMDYEVFLLARIKEFYDAGESPDAAVRHGLQRSGRIITSAALLMLIVFACFAAADIGALQQIGLGLFVAVLIDATLVRCLLSPALMTVLGRAAWWAPAPLRRLHARIGLHEAGERPAEDRDAATLAGSATTEAGRSEPDPTDVGMPAPRHAAPEPEPAGSRSH